MADETLGAFVVEHTKDGQLRWAITGNMPVIPLLGLLEIAKHVLGQQQLIQQQQKAQATQIVMPNGPLPRFPA